MNNVNTVLVAFSATSIHKKLTKAALDIADENNAKLIILNVRDKNVTQMVANITKNQGFLGRDVVEKLAEDIKKDRDELIVHRLSIIGEEASKREIEFEIVQAKGNLPKKVVETANTHAVDVVLVDSSKSDLNYIEEKTGIKVYQING